MGTNVLKLCAVPLGCTSVLCSCSYRLRWWCAPCTRQDPVYCTPQYSACTAEALCTDPQGTHCGAVHVLLSAGHVLLSLRCSAVICSYSGSPGYGYILLFVHVPADMHWGMCKGVPCLRQSSSLTHLLLCEKRMAWLAVLCHAAMTFGCMCFWCLLLHRNLV